MGFQIILSHYAVQFSSVQFSSIAKSCPTLCNSMNRSTPGLPVHHQLLESTQTHVHWVGDAIRPSHPLWFPSPPALIFPSIRVFSNEIALHIRWPKYWSFSFNISPANEHPGLISFRMDWLDLLAVQGTLKSLLQHHSSKASILQRSAFFIVQLSHPYMTTGKIICCTTFKRSEQPVLYVIIVWLSSCDLWLVALHLCVSLDVKLELSVSLRGCDLPLHSYSRWLCGQSR